MNMISIFRCSNMKGALDFYTRVLDFQLGNAAATEAWPVVAIRNGDAWLMLTTLEGDQKPGISAAVAVENVDELYHRYIGRGLDTSARKDSPVHQAPLDQTWGTREFYVTDPDGNTLRFMQFQ